MPSDDWAIWWRHYGETPLRHLLLLYWDPIGIYGEPATLDEYDRYGNHVCSMLMGGESATAISTYLRGIALDRMGIPSPEADDAARRVVEWFNDSTAAFFRAGWAEQRREQDASPPG